MSNEPNYPTNKEERERRDEERKRLIALAEWLRDHGANASAHSRLAGEKGRRAYALRTEVAAASGPLDSETVFALLTDAAGKGWVFPMIVREGETASPDAEAREALERARKAAGRILKRNLAHLSFEHDRLLRGGSIGLPAFLALLAHCSDRRLRRPVAASGRLADGRSVVGNVGHLDAKLQAVIDERSRFVALIPEQEVGPAANDPRVFRVRSLEEAAQRLFELSKIEAPYCGLSSFDESRAGLFFGRDELVSELVGLVEQQGTLVLTGDSGCGKSSLLGAGLIPGLRRTGRPQRTHRLAASPQPINWLPLLFRPGDHPLESLRRLLSEALRIEILAEHTDPVALRDMVESWCARHNRHLVVLVDQAEELVTTSLATEAERVAEILAVLGETAEAATRVVLSVRADFLGRIGELSILRRVARAAIVIHGLDQDELEAAIVHPAARFGGRFEPGLVARIIEDSKGSEPLLPLLQTLGTRLWQHVDSSEISSAAYLRVGGVTGALSDQADRVVERMTASQLSTTRRVLLSLVGPSGTRVALRLTELQNRTRGDFELDRVLDALVRGRICRASVGADEEPTYELVHETLIVHWECLARWTRERLSSTEYLGRLRPAAASWLEHGALPPTLVAWPATSSDRGVSLRRAGADQART